MDSLLLEVMGWIAKICFVIFVIVVIAESCVDLLRVSITAVSWGLRITKIGIDHFLNWLLSQLRKGASAAIGKIKQSYLSWWPANYQASMQQITLYWFYLKEGRKEFVSFAAFKQDWQEHGQYEREGESDSQHSNNQPSSAYAQALEILGLSEQVHFTVSDLKLQFRKMRSLVHPDKGFPNRVFIQQLNDAFATVKRERNWV